MDALFLITFCFYWLVQIFVYWQVVNTFFPERRTPLWVVIAAFAVFYLSVISMFLLELPTDYQMTVSMFVAMLPLAIMFCYRASILKRIIVFIGYFVIMTALEIMVLAIFGVHTIDEHMYAQVGIEGMIAKSTLLFLIGLFFRRLKNVKKNTIKSPMFWVAATVAPLISFVMLFWIFEFFPGGIINVVAGFLVFLLNTLFFIIYDVLSASFEYRLKASAQMTERMQTMLDSSPLACAIIDEDFNIIEINQRTMELFNIPNPEAFISNHLKFSPEQQDCGKPSQEKFQEIVTKAFEDGFATCNWAHINSDGEIIPCEITLKRVFLSEKNMVMHYIHDLREVHALQTAKVQMEKLAFTDSLTGLYNRRYFMDNSEEALQDCIDNNYDFSIVMMDIDYFKKINDTYGHSVGDEVLKIFAKRLKHVLRNSEIVARFGGEEFIVALPKARKVSALIAAHRVHGNVRKLPFVVGDLSIPVTTSIGVATKERVSDTLQSIIDAADTAVYEAKNGGRDRVVSG